jgi:hypothetical protein
MFHVISSLSQKSFDALRRLGNSERLYKLEWFKTLDFTLRCVHFLSFLFIPMGRPIKQHKVRKPSFLHQQDDNDRGRL